MSGFNEHERKALDEAIEAACKKLAERVQEAEERIRKSPESVKMAENVAKMQDLLVNVKEETRIHGTVLAETADKLKAVGEKGNELATKFGEHRAEVLEWMQKNLFRGAGGGEQQKSIYEYIIESPQWQKICKDPSATAMDPVKIPHALLMKTQIINATGQNQPLVPAARTGLIVPAEQRLFLRDLVPQTETDSNSVELVVESSYTSNARSQGDASPGNIEGEEFAESAMAFTLTPFPVVTIGHHIPASRQVLSDAKLLQGPIGTRLLYGLRLEEEQQMLTGDGTAGNINGVNNQAAAYNRGQTNDTVLDTLSKAFLQVSLSNYEPSAVVMHPSDWNAATLLKDSQNRYLFSDPQAMVAPRVWGKPVVPTQNQTIGRFTAGAFGLGAQIWDREDAMVRISENVGRQFVQNMVTILAVERTLLVVLRTTAFVYGNTSHAG